MMQSLGSLIGQVVQGAAHTAAPLRRRRSSEGGHDFPSPTSTQPQPSKPGKPTAVPRLESVPSLGLSGRLEEPLFTPRLRRFE